MGNFVLYELFVVWPVYIGLLIFVLVRNLRGNAKKGAVVFLLVALSVAVRFVFCERLPVVAATADPERVLVSVLWHIYKPKWESGSYPAGFASLLYLLLFFIPQTLDNFFAFTTILGGLVTGPVFGIASKLGGFRAGVLASLAYTALPISIIFSNGANYVIPACLMLSMTIWHVLCYFESQRLLDLLLALMASALFVQMRPESSGHFVLMAITIVAMALFFKPRLSLAKIALLSFLALLLLGPYFLEFLRTMPPTYSGRAEKALLPILCHGVASLVLALTWTKRPIRFLAFAGSVTLAILLVALALPSFSLFPEWKEAIAIPDGFIHSPVYVPLSYGPTASHFLTNPYLYPILFMFLAPFAPFGALKPSAQGCSIALFLLFLSIDLLAKFAGGPSGEIIADGARYVVPSAGLFAVCVGLGASFFARSLPKPIVAFSFAGLLLLSPLFTHYRILKDMDFNEQRRYLFIKDALSTLPERTFLLLPDHEVLGDGVPENAGPVMFASRSNALFGLLYYTTRKPTQFDGVRRGVERVRHFDGSIVFFHDLDCYRTNDGTPDPLCERLLHLPGAKILASTRFKNRPYTRYPIVLSEDIELAFVLLPAQGYFEAIQEEKR